MKNSVVLEAMGSVFEAAEIIKPHMAGLKENQKLVADARLAFGTQVLASGMNRLVSRSMDGVYCLIMGKMFLEGMAVEMNYERSASFIDYGNCEAYFYLGKQYERGLGLKEDKRKAVEMYARMVRNLKTPNVYTKWDNVFVQAMG